MFYVLYISLSDSGNLTHHFAKKKKRGLVYATQSDGPQQQVKFQHKAAAEKEKMNADSLVGVVSDNGHAAVREAEESQEINNALSAGAIDPDTKEDIDMGEHQCLVVF